MSLTQQKELPALFTWRFSGQDEHWWLTSGWFCCSLVAYHTQPRVPGASCLGPTRWKDWKQSTLLVTSDEIPIHVIFFTFAVQLYCTVLVHDIPSDNVMSLAWMPGSNHHKAGGSLEVQGVLSGMTSMLLKSHIHRYIRHGNSIILFERDYWNLSVTAVGGSYLYSGIHMQNEGV